MTIAIYGASGTTGRLVARALGGEALVLAGRDAIALEGVAAEVGRRATVMPATVDDPRALAAAFRDVRVVIGCAGPFGACGEPVLEAAIAAGAHYLDVAGEQGFLREMYERHDSEARRAGVCAVPGMGLEVAPGDLAAAEAAAALAPTEDEPLDEVSVSYLLDRFSPTPGTQRSALAVAAAPAVEWRHDRWDVVTPASERRRVNAGAAGDREVVSFPSGEVITVPRHVPAARVATFVSWSRNPWAARAASLLAPALPLLARAVPSRWVSEMALDDRLRTAASFAIVAIARRGFDEARTIVSGRDVYATSAAIVAWAARELVRRATPPAGVRAPAEVFGPLDAVADAAGMVVARHSR